MTKTIAILLLATVMGSALGQEAVPGEPRLSAWLTNQPMTKSYRWRLESAVVVGDKLSCIASKQTYLDPVSKPFHGETHLSSPATEYAYVAWSIARGNKSEAPALIVPLGSHKPLTRDYTLLPGATNILVRKSERHSVTDRVAFECWSLHPPATNITLSQEVCLPHSKYREGITRVLGGGYRGVLLLTSNQVLCLNLPGLTTNLNFTGQRILDDYFSSLGKTAQVLSAQVAGDLDYLVCHEEHLDPVRQEIAVVDLRSGGGVARQSRTGSEANVLDGEVVFLKSQYEKIPSNRFKHSYQIISRTGAVRASLEIDLAGVLAWSCGSSTVVFEIKAKDQGRKSDLLVWDFQSGQHWPITVRLPEKLAK